VFIRKNIIISTICLFLFSSVWSQNNNTEDAPLEAKTAAKEKALAKHAYELGDPYTAIHYYENYLEMRPKDSEALQQLADLYKLTRDYTRAAKAYNTLYNSDKLNYQLDLYNKAIMEKMSGEYAQAKIDLLKYQSEAGKLIEKNLKNQLKVDLEGCDSALKYLEYPLSVEVSNAGKSVNNPHVEFGPFPLDSNCFLFGSLISDTVHFYDIRYGHKEEQPVRTFYTAEKINNEWVKQASLDEINDPNAIMGKVIFSKNTDTYYFTKCKKSAKGETVCAIYSRQIVKGKMQEVEDLGTLVNLPGFTSTQPAIAYDSATKKETLYFASNRPGGKGDLDIYYTSYDSKRKAWKKPSSLGSKVNTSGTECTPFYSDSEQALYLAPMDLQEWVG
jgi:OmpA-OmpF porin, OOP family